jgi:hypothetical protein
MIGSYFTTHRVFPMVMDRTLRQSSNSSKTGANGRNWRRGCTLFGRSTCLASSSTFDSALGFASKFQFMAGVYSREPRKKS